VIIISPNFGAIGAPQLGHLIEVTPEGAIIDAGFWEEPAGVLAGCPDVADGFILAPHL